MATSLYYEESSSSDKSEFDEVSDFEEEREEFDSLSEGTSASEPMPSEDVVSALSGFTPYDDEPIADEEWLRMYQEKKEKESNRVKALQDRLDEEIPVTDW